MTCSGFFELVVPGGRRAGARVGLPSAITGRSA
jgi:hypothetical protein